MRERSLLPARVALVLFVLAGVLLPLAASVHARLAGPRLHDAVIGIAGPTLVAQEAGRRANALEGHPVDARVLSTDDDVDGADGALPRVRALVARGELDAAVVVDLRRTTDTLLLPDWLPDRVTTELRNAAVAVSASYGRQLDTTRVGPAVDAPRRLPGQLTALLVVVGLTLAAGISAWRGPVAATTTRGVARLVGTAAGGAALGVGLTVLLAAAVGGVARGMADAVGLALACAAVVTVAAWLVLAAEALLGLAGLGLATGLLVGPVVPLLGGADPAYLPSPWSQLDSLGPEHAALRLLQHDLFGLSVAQARSWLVLGAWAVIALLTLAAARAARPSA